MGNVASHSWWDQGWSWWWGNEEEDLQGSTIPHVYFYCHLLLSKQPWTEVRSQPQWSGVWTGALHMAVRKDISQAAQWGSAWLALHPAMGPAQRKRCHFLIILQELSTPPGLY